MKKASMKFSCTKEIFAALFLLFFSLSLLLSFSLALTGCAQKNTNSVQLYQETQSLLGTTVTITLSSANQSQATRVLTEAFDEIKRIESIFSNYNNNSVISQLNEKGYYENPTFEVQLILRKSKYYGSITKNSFDISVQPILDLYKESFAKNQRPPTAEEINKTLELVNYRNIGVSEQNLTLEPGMKITVGGAVKGYAIDQAIAVLKDNYIPYGLINAGGDIRAYGVKPNKEKPVIALQNPRDKTGLITKFNISNESVATSGDYERYFNKNKTFHHIVDPRTGYSATHTISSTVIAKTATQADILATSIFIMNITNAMKLINKLDYVEAMIIDSNKTIHYSNHFPILVKVNSTDDENISSKGDLEASESLNNLVK